MHSIFSPTYTKRVGEQYGFLAEDLAHVTDPHHTRSYLMAEVHMETPRNTALLFSS